MGAGGAPRITETHQLLQQVQGAPVTAKAAPPLVCAGLEIALNRYLQIEPAALAECAAMSRERVAIEIEGIAWELLIEFDARGVRVIGESTAAASVRLIGTPSAFTRMAGKRGGDAGLPPGLRIEGDALVLQRFRQLLESVGFDLAEWLAPLLGNGAAHRIAQGVRSLFSWGRKSADTLSLDAAEYLREETRDLARGVDVADWMDEVDRLRERTDRMDARIARLERQRGAA